MLSRANGRLSVYRQRQQPSARAFEQLLRRCSKEPHPKQCRQEGVSVFSPDVNVCWAWQDVRQVLSYMLHAPCCLRTTAPLTCSFPGEKKEPGEVPGEKPGESNLEPLCCKVTVLTATLPSYNHFIITYI